MKKQLFQAVFAKAESEFHTKAKYTLADTLAQWCDEEHGYPITGKTLVRYYDKYLLDTPLPQEPKLGLLDCMALYLGYANYETYLKENGEEVVPEPAKKQPVERIVAVAITLLVGGLLSFNLLTGSPDDSRCMYWDGSRYLESSCDITQVPNQKPLPLDHTLLKRFQQLQPDCDTRFFDGDQPLIFYGKNHKGTYEFFTYPGKHPLTGKHLKPITAYMISKYICPLENVE